MTAPQTSTARRRPAKLLVLVLAMVTVGLAVWAWEPLYWWVMTKREPSIHKGEPEQRGWVTVNRWTGKVYGRYVIYYVEAGFMATDGELDSEGALVKYTHWNPDGTVVIQDWIPPGELEMQSREGPPWWWGVTDQTEPTMPEWMKDDEQWQAALDAQGR